MKEKLNDLLFKVKIGKILAIMLIAMLISATLAGCSLTNTSALEMGELKYDPITKVLSWNKVKGATSYYVKISLKGENPITETFSSKETKVDFEAKPTGGYYVEVKAKNSKTISKAASLHLSHIQKQILQASDVRIDQKNKLLYWHPVENATGYQLTITGAGETKELFVDDSFFNEETGLYELSIADRQPEVPITVSLAVKGDEIDFVSSEPVSKEVTLLDENLFEYLQMSQIKYENGLLSWAAVEKATGYQVDILKNGVVLQENVPYTLNAQTGELECPMEFSRSMDFTVSVTVLGDDVYIQNSEARTADFRFEREYSYVDLTDLIKEKTEPILAKNGKVSDFSVFAVDIDKSEVIVSYNSGGEKFAKIELNTPLEDNISKTFETIDSLNFGKLKIETFKASTATKENILRFVEEMIDEGDGYIFKKRLKKEDVEGILLESQCLKT